jgi:hypothetical protein
MMRRNAGGTRKGRPGERVARTFLTTIASAEVVTARRIRNPREPMSGRRSHQRFDVSLPSAGTLRVSKDVVVERMERDELVVTCREPGVRNERLSVHFPDADGSAALPVTVADSRPVLVGGAVRYQLQLRVCREASGGGGNE